MDYYKGNCGTIYIYRSMCKNAKCLRDINVVHLITHDPEGKLTDEGIIDHFVSTLDKIFVASESEFYMSVDMIENREVRGLAKPQGWYWESDRKKFRLPFTMIHWLWFNFFCRIYPYNTVEFTKGIEMNPSIKYMIEKWQEAQNETRLGEFL